MKGFLQKKIEALSLRGFLRAGAESAARGGGGGAVSADPRVAMVSFLSVFWKMCTVESM